MTQTPQPPDPTAPEPSPTPDPSTAPGAPVDDRRADPPAPASARLDGAATGTESQREAQETVRSISRLEESN